MADWIEVTVTTVSAASEAVSYFMETLGCAGVLLEPEAAVVEMHPRVGDRGAPIEEGSSEIADDPWRAVVIVKGYLPILDEAGGAPHEEDARIVRLTEHLRQIPSWGLAAAPPDLSLRTVRDEDWADAWKQHYHPIAVGERFVVHPTWEEPGEDLRDRIPIRLDPGMAFGTGAHPSTVLSLEALERLVKPGARVLDVGVGSGILSIAAARLGASSIVGCDHDPVAAKAARQNAEENGVSDRVHVVHRPAEEVDGTYDCIVANLVADLLIDLADWIARRLAPQGVVLGGGIVDRRETDVAEAWARVGFEVTRIDRLGEWRAVEATRS